MDPLPHEDLKAGEDNDSDGGQVCTVSSDIPPLAANMGQSSEQHWLVRRLLSVIKYLLFAAFVLACNKLRRFVKAHRHRVNSTSSFTDGIDVRNL